MREVVLYIACSLDMYIARPDGAIDWLFSDQDYGYYDFLKTIDTVLMGNVTYQQILSGGIEYPYPDLANYVFTKSPRENDKNVRFVNQDPVEFVSGLKKEVGRHIWLVGGAQICHLFLQAGMVDRLILSIHPVSLGQGLPLFPSGQYSTDWELLRSDSFASGLVQLEYLKKQADRL